MVSLEDLRKKELLAVEVPRTLQLGDLRPHAPNWPVLQSLRFLETQELAKDAHAAGLDGLIYRSAQQHGQDCVMLFDPPADLVTVRKKSPLVGPAGTVNRCVAAAADRSKVPLTPQSYGWFWAGSSPRLR